jgi:hypothetical protein
MIELIETIAKALWKDDCRLKGGYEPNNDHWPDAVASPTYYRDWAKTMVTAVTAEGYRIVDREHLLTAAHWIEACPFENALPHAARLREDAG